MPEQFWRRSVAAGSAPDARDEMHDAQATALNYVFRPKDTCSLPAVERPRADAPSSAPVMLPVH